MDLRPENKSIFRSPSIVIALIAAVAVLFVVLNIMPRVDRYLTIRAIETCGNITKFERNNVEESFKASYPLQDLYTKCLANAK